MANILPRDKRISVLHHLVEGNTLRSTTRLTGVHRTTIMNLLVDFGADCQAYMDRTLRNLSLTHLEVDELYTFVQKKQARLTIDEKAERRGIFGIGESEERSICTSHVERHNLTIRTLMKRFTRLSLGFSKKLENLEAACAMFLCFYNYVWRTRDAEAGRTRLPAAMAAGVVNTLWSFEDMYDQVTAA